MSEPAGWDPFDAAAEYERHVPRERWQVRVEGDVVANPRSYISLIREYRRQLAEGFDAEIWRARTDEPWTRIEKLERALRRGAVGGDPA